MSNQLSTPRRRLPALLTAGARMRMMPLALISAVAATALLSLSMTGALSSFSASIVNNANTMSSATVQLSQTQSAVTCVSTAALTAIGAANSSTCTNNAYGASTNNVPGGTASVQTITMTNVGTNTASVLSLTAGACVSSNSTAALHGSGNLCGLVDIAINETTTGATNQCLFPVASTTACVPSTSGTLTTLNSVNSGVLALGTLNTTTARTFTVSVQISATADNTAQGLAATQSLTWALS